MELTKIQITKLESNNWVQWKYRMTALLSGIDGLLDIVEGRTQMPVRPVGAAGDTAAAESMPKELEKLEEAKLKAKFPNTVLARGPAGHSAFLQKRLAKGQKFFDSGDYQMAKQRPGNLTGPFKAPAAPPKLPTGDAIPTPETVPIRKTSIIQPKFQPSSQTS